MSPHTLGWTCRHFTRMGTSRDRGGQCGIGTSWVCHLPLQLYQDSSRRRGDLQGRGNRHKEGIGIDGRELNPFQWSHIRLNMPGTKEYDPCNSWISKMRADGRVACNLLSFVDNERLSGLDEEITRQASNTLCRQTELSGGSGCREEGSAVQPAAGSVGSRGNRSCPAHPRRSRVNVGGQVDKVKGDIEEMAGSALGS